MAMGGGVSDLRRLIALFSFLLSAQGATAVKFTFRNNCPETVCPATLTSSGPAFPTTGFVLAPGASVSFPGVGATWSGRVWGRYRCTTTSGARFTCESGDCGTGQVACNGAGGAPPATLAELTLGGGVKDFYDVSNVDGFNLPMQIEPATDGRCQRTSCPADINRVCPSELAVRATAAPSSATSGGGGGDAVVGCKSACLAFGTDEYCCRGQFASPATCKPSGYSRLFKAQCPQAYSYAYDDRSSTFTCNGTVDYQVAFCPGSRTSMSHADAVLPPDGNSL
ncbi:Thaumatin-like protein 1a [Dichanthelium oligosanthes]|uniref:Thaumatin-like protein 1a n=1 Tax=Dichanthelium oligosanthes TaxID=888268 RepID=A0A1E5V1A0_9POAL|nr:Thaumatin-like protein 1a [Dichanthelium oligosanthes]